MQSNLLQMAEVEGVSTRKVCLKLQMKLHQSMTLLFLTTCSKERISTEPSLQQGFGKVNSTPQFFANRLRRRITKTDVVRAKSKSQKLTVDLDFELTSNLAENLQQTKIKKNGAGSFPTTENQILDNFTMMYQLRFEVFPIWRKLQFNHAEKWRLFYKAKMHT